MLAARHEAARAQAELIGGQIKENAAEIGLQTVAARSYIRGIGVIEELFDSATKEPDEAPKAEEKE